MIDNLKQELKIEIKSIREKVHRYITSLSTGENGDPIDRDILLVNHTLSLADLILL